MFVIQLHFADKSRAGELMSGHKEWIARGFDEGVFLLVGNLEPGLGGALLAHGASRGAIEARVGEDPFVAEGVVTAAIHEIAPSRTDARLEFLLRR